jgi:carnosine N-methyltransferase
LTGSSIDGQSSKPPMADDTGWTGVEEVATDPEEVRVIFSALDSFLQYARTAHLNVTHVRRQSFYSLPQAHWQMLAAPPFNYLDTLDKVDDAIDSNAELARAIVRTGLQSFQAVETEPGSEPVLPAEWQGSAKGSDIDKARSTLRQFYRDWSAEGAAERQACYGPVVNALENERRKKGAETATSDRHEGGKTLQPLRVLVPGAGLGRLLFDLCCQGYEVEGNEISYHQLLASSYILNCTDRAGQHNIYPWIHSFSNHLTRTNHLRGYAVPDIHPATAITSISNTPSQQDIGMTIRPGGSMAMCASDFLLLYGDTEHSEIYDAVASVFFLDTAPNLIRYLETIWHCLRTGGILINVGPLLWHFENNPPGSHGLATDKDEETQGGSSDSTGIADPGSFELTDDEVMALLDKLGFVIEKKEHGVHAPYIQDSKSMMQTTYRASVWVARKIARPVEEQSSAIY